MNKIENADTKIQVKKKVKSQSKGQQDKVNVTNLTVSSDSKISNQVMKIKNKKRKLDSSSASLQNALAATDNGDTNETKKILTSQTKGQQDKVNVKNLTVSSDSKISNQAIERQTRRKRELNKEGDAGDTNLTLSSESKISNQVTETNNNNKRKRESSVEDLEKRLPVANSSETKQVTKKVKLETETRQSTANDPNLTVSTDSKIVNQVMARQQRRRRESNKGGDGAVKHPFRCTVSGCSRKTSFPTLKGLFKHNNLYHRYLRCGACGEIKEVYDFNNSHLKNNPQCGEVDPLPWDKKKGVEAKDWLVTRNVTKTTNGTKTSFGCKKLLVNTHNDSGTFVEKFRCTVKGCSTTFWLSSHSLWEHNRKYHQHVKCGACGQIDKLLEFNKSHLKNNPECAAVDPQPWDKNQGVEATDWIPIRIVKKNVTTFRCEHEIGKTKEKPFRCTVFGCSRKSSFSTSKALLHHTNKYHRYLRCGACGEIQELYEFNKFHLKNNPQCGEVDPLPWDKKNGVEAKDWLVTRNVTKTTNGTKTSFGCKKLLVNTHNDSGTFVKKFRCTKQGCPPTFWFSYKGLWKHNSLNHRHVMCGGCGQIFKLSEFNNSHLMDKLLCAKVDPKPWDNENAMEATDWLVKRIRFKGKTRFWSQRLADPGKGPESDTDSDENITFGTESNVYINHSRKPDRTTWLRKYLDRNASTLMTCEVFGCSYHTTHAVLLRYHYKTQHSSLMTNWSVSFDAASEKIHQCFKPKCGFKTNSEHLFEFHNERHTKMFSFQCFLCHQLYKNKNTLMEHLMENHKILRNPNKFVVYIYAQKSKPKRRMEGKSFFCRICCRQIQTRSLENHMNIIHPPKLPQQNCQFCYPEAYCKRSAELSDKTTTLKCCYKTCCFETHTFQEFREHSLTHHFFRSQILAHETNISSSANVSFQCPRKNCKFNARSQMVLSRHENKHKQGLTASCLLCNEICSNTEKFLNHVRIRHKIHTNQLALYDDCNEHKGILNIYRCNIESCTGFMSGVKSFYEDHLIHHLDHTSNTFSCGVCSLPLDTGRDLIAHFEQSHNKADLAIKSVNIPTTLSCDLCPYLVFNSNTIFILHHQLHHPELVTSVVDEMYPDFYKKSRRFKTFSTSPFRAEGEVECVKM